MKKVLSIVAIAMLFIATSCSKEAKLNRKLDGEWNVTTVDGVALDASATLTFKFEKDKKGNGKVTTTSTDTDIDYQGQTEYFSQTGTYTLTKDEVITMTFVDSESSGVTAAVTVTDYDKSNMTFTVDGYTYVLKKK